MEREGEEQQLSPDQILMALASTVISAARQTGDERLQRIASLAVREVKNSASIEDVIMACGAAQQQPEDPHVSAMRERNKINEQLQESIVRQRQNQQAANQLVGELLPGILKELFSVGENRGSDAVAGGSDTGTVGVEPATEPVDEGPGSAAV